MGDESQTVRTPGRLGMVLSLERMTQRVIVNVAATLRIWS